MNNFFTFLLIILFSSFLFVGLTSAQENSDERIWSVVKLLPVQTKEILPDISWQPVEPSGLFYDFLDGITVGPNFRPLPSSNATQSETSVDVHPSNNNIVFCSANATDLPVDSVFGSGVYWSLNGGSNWTGFNLPPFGMNSGDPVSVIGSDGKFYENYIASSGGQGIAVSTNNGANWTTYTVAPNPGSLADKNHYMVDKKSGSPFLNRSYCTWTDFGGTNDGQAVLRYSTNFGVTWSASINLSGTLSPGSHAQGVNVQTGPNGEVYVTYAIYDAWPGGEDAIGFSKSTNGGVSWTHNRIYSAVNFGIRGTLSSKSGIRVSSFPSMAVDRSGGTNDGTIYITWPQRGVSPAGSDPDIVFIKSTNGGTTWTSPVRVNNDPLNNGKDQYYPWCTVDQATGQFMIVFYDSRDVVNNLANVYMARSLDGGASFENFKVSDQAHTPSPISGLASGYAGDYIGVAAHNDVAYPYWGENRTGNYQGWMAKVTFGPPCPIGTPTNPNPPNLSTNVSKSLSQLSWTNGAGTTQCEVWFGANANMTKVYDGIAISSWTITPPLSYNTSYNWQIINKDGTCSTSGPSWSFTTELSPGIIFSENFNNLNCWTAIGPLGTTNWSLQNTSNAGGTSPELRLDWSPEFNGLSKFNSCNISVLANRHYSITFKHMIDWFANTAPTLGLGVSYDNGSTYSTVWSIVPTGNVGPQTISASFITPANASTMNLVFYLNGNSYNIDYWYIDDITLNDDDFLAVADPTNVLSSAISSSQINVSFNPNINNNNVVVVWNLTGTFSVPAGAPPAIGQPFAGGTVLYYGTTSPVNHTGLNSSTTYFYKLFSYPGTSYSNGVVTNASTPNISDPANVNATPISGSQINIAFTPNSFNNNVVLVWNNSGNFTTPAGSPPVIGQPFAGGTLLFNGITSPVNHTGLNPSTNYYYKAFSYNGINYSAGVTTNATTLWLLDFGVNFLVSDNCNNQVSLLFGTAPGATDCFDPGLDQSAPPPPPVGAFDGRFSSCGEPWFTDIRATNQSGERIWYLSYTPSSGCNPVSFSWNPLQLPTTGYFHLVDPFYGNMVNINMRTTNSFTDAIGLGQLLIKFSYQINSKYNVSSGWNMISLPVDVVDNNYLTIFPNAIPGSLYKYSGSYSSTEIIENCLGYWLKFPSSEIADIYGMDRIECDINLNTGWNLIGGPNCNVPLSSIIDPGGIIIPGTLYGYSGTYFSATTIDATKGYWIKSSSSGTITISCGSSLSNNLNPDIFASENLDEFSKIKISDAEGSNQTLYFKSELAEGLNIESFSMPPLPPQGSFDARLVGDYRLTERDEATIQVQINVYPVRIKISNLNTSEKYMLVEIANGIEVGTQPILDGNEVIINNQEVTVLQITKAQEVPVSFNLEQNYPNPFNPSTTIKFSLPEASEVRLNIYNSLGEKVAELVNSTLESGWYSYNWDARYLPSGIYFYELWTDNFVSSKKMILMK